VKLWKECWLSFSGGQTKPRGKFTGCGGSGSVQLRKGGGVLASVLSVILTKPSLGSNIGD